MTMRTRHLNRRLAALFADILDYPAVGLQARAAECQALLARLAPSAGDLLGEFRAFADQASPGRLEEAYSGFFDLNPLCHPYIGYQLFGENYKRSTFLVALKDRYRTASFEATPAEIPDRLSVVLRYIAVAEPGADTDDLVREGLLPALERMTARPASNDHHHDGQGDFDGDTGVERRELDGHADGDALAGGFVLALSEDTDPDGVPDEAPPHPYYRALQALQVALRETWKA